MIVSTRDLQSRPPTTRGRRFDAREAAARDRLSPDHSRADPSSAIGDAARDFARCARRRRAPPRSGCPRSTRAMRIQVVWGNCRSAGRGHIGEIEGHQPEAAGLKHEVHRLQRAGSASPGSRTHSSRREIERRRPRPTPGRTRSHVSISATASPRAAAAPSIAADHSVVRPAERAPTISDRWPRRETAAERLVEAGDPLGRHASLGRGRPRGRDVSVTSSFRVLEGADSSSARAAAIFAFYSPRAASIVRR